MLALTLNFSFFVGDIDNPEHHPVYELFAAIVVSLIATVIKFGDRSHLGAVLLAASLVADLQLIAAAVLWGIAVHMLAPSLHGPVMAALSHCQGAPLSPMLYPSYS